MSISMEQLAAGQEAAADGAPPDAMYFSIFSHIAQKDTQTVQRRLEEFAHEARLADELGFDYFFTTEHHFSKGFSLSPSQAISLTVLAQVTTRLRFGPMIIIMPISQPLRVAEEMLILDHMSGGRLEVGVGRGIRSHEHIAYGIKTHEDQGRLEEGLEFLLRAWESEEKFSWFGEYYSYVDVEMPWRPLQRPHPPIWIPTGTPQHAKEAGAKGYGNGGFALLGKDLYRQVFDAYREGWKSSGRPTADQRIAWLTSVVVADTDAEARALAYEHFPKQIARFEYEASRTYSLVDSVRRKRVDRSFDLFKRLTSDLEGAERNLAFICGGPDTVAEKIQHLQEDMGVNVFMGEYSFGELEYEHVARSLRLMAEQVMPRFKRPSSPRPAGAAR